MTLSGYFMTKCVFGRQFLNQSLKNPDTIKNNIITFTKLLCNYRLAKISVLKILIYWHMNDRDWLKWTLNF